MNIKHAWFQVQIFIFKIGAYLAFICRLKCVSYCLWLRIDEEQGSVKGRIANSEEP